MVSGSLNFAWLDQLFDSRWYMEFRLYNILNIGSKTNVSRREHNRPTKQNLSLYRLPHRLVTTRPKIPISPYNVKIIKNTILHSINKITVKRHSPYFIIADTKNDCPEPKITNHSLIDIKSWGSTTFSQEIRINLMPKVNYVEYFGWEET